MNSIKQAVPIIMLLAVAVVTLPISAHESQLMLINNVRNLDLNMAALGVLSTLNIYYFIGLSATLVSFALSIRYRSNALTIVCAFIIIMYFVGYPLLLSPFPPYLGDGTAFASNSLLILLFGYSNVAKQIYNGGAYPMAFIWNIIISIVLSTQLIYVSSIYGLFEPIALGLISYIIGRSMNRNNDALASLAVLIFIALIWSYQFHFSPQDFNIVVLMLTAPLLPMVIKGDLKAITLISLVTVALTLGHPTEDPILLAALFSLLVLRIIKRYKEFRPLVLTTSVVTAMSFVMYSSYVIPVNISVMSNLFSLVTVERFISILIGKVSHAVYFAVTNYNLVYPLRSVVYKYELYGGYVMALFQLAAVVVLYILLWFRESDNYKQAYVSLVLGGLLVDALITLALGSYSNRLAIYSAPILSGLLLPYIVKMKSHVKPLVFIALIALGFIGLVFSGSTIYWDYSAGNPITYQSYYVIYSLGYHHNIGSIYNTNWLIGYELLSIRAKTGTIYYQSFTSSLFDYNKDDLLYIANDINMGNYTLILNRLMQTSIIYNDGINLISSRYMMH